MRKLSIISFLFVCQSLAAQTLFIPRSVQKAYENKTRSTSGRPGVSYWQNESKYTIQIKLVPEERKVYGKAEIKYINNSPDTLKTLNYKLILNHHKATSPRLFPVSKDYLTNGIEITKYTEDGEKCPWNSENDGVNKLVYLKKPLAPNSSIDLAFEWNFELSKQSGREGVIDSTTFFLAYFFPRVAVYDDYEGWDKMTTQGSQEFYSDFGDYTFEVSVPKNYLVWATGDLQNPKDVLQKKYADLLEKSHRSEEVLTIVNQEDIAKQLVTAQSDWNIWKWKAYAVPDIAIAVSNHYNWDAGSVIVDSLSGRRASVQAVYDEPSKDFKQMVGFGKHALNWFSHHYPGVAYPYSKMTIFRGFADMEYPMMANDNSQDDPALTKFIVEHEIAHTYFPFYMGINETRFAFMDEGWATALEHLIRIDDLGAEKAIAAFKEFRVNNWTKNTSQEVAIPIITPSNTLGSNRISFGSNAYGKAALGYLAVKDLLGDKVFKQALQGYMDRWNGKHPIPWDFFNSFNDLSVQDLNWFWENWFFSSHYMDLALKKVGSGSVTINNVGGLYIPFDVIVTYQNGSKMVRHYTSTIWKNGKNTVTVALSNMKNVQSIVIDGGIWVDANQSDNEWIKK